MTPAAGNEMTVVWTRGNGCSELAALLSEDVPDRITGDLVEQHQPPGRSPRLTQIPWLVRSGECRRASRLRAPEREAGGVGRGRGPHSFLAADTASRLGRGLGVESEMLSAIRPGDDPREAEDLLDHIGLSVPEIGGRVVEVEGISELVESSRGGDARRVRGSPVGPGCRGRCSAREPGCGAGRRPEPSWCAALRTGCSDGWGNLSSSARCVWPTTLSVFMSRECWRSPTRVC